MRDSTRHAGVQHPSPVVHHLVALPIETGTAPGKARTRKPSLPTRLKAVAGAGLTGDLKPDGTITNLKPNDGPSGRQEGNGAGINPWDEVPDYGDEAH